MVLKELRKHFLIIYIYIYKSFYTFFFKLRKPNPLIAIPGRGLDGTPLGYQIVTPLTSYLENSVPPTVSHNTIAHIHNSTHPKPK